MIQILQPQLFVRSIYDINLDRLRSIGMRGLILDLDNTLVGWNQPHASEELMDWLKQVKGLNFDMCIVSNNLLDRVQRFAARIEVKHIAKAAKPRRRAFRMAMQKMGTRLDTTAVVGDQVFTDILGGNRLGLYTILVHPMDHKEFWTTKIVRQLEHAVVPRMTTES